MKKNRETKEMKNLEKIHLTLAIIILLWLNVGVYTYISKNISDIIKFAIYGVWLGLAIFNKKEYVIHLLKITFPLVIFLILLIILNNEQTQMYITNLIYVLIIVSIFIYYMNDSRKKRNIILTVLMMDIIYVGINTFFQLEANERLARILATGQNIIDGVEVKGVGNYGYFYSLVMILLVLIDYVSQRNKKFYFSSIIAIIFFSILLIKGQFTISILLYIIFAAKIILERKIKNKFILYITITLTVILMSNTMGYILEQIIQIEEVPTTIKIRLEEIKDSLNGNSSESTDLQSRKDLYKKSMDSFLNNILIGNLGEKKVRRAFIFFRFIRIIWINFIIMFCFLY